MRVWGQTSLKIIQNPSMTEQQCALSLSAMEPVNLLPSEMNWSSYYLSRGSKKSRADVVKLNLPCQTVEQKSVPTLPHVTDLQSMFKFQYVLFELLRRNSLGQSSLPMVYLTKNLWENQIAKNLMKECKWIMSTFMKIYYDCN